MSTREERRKQRASWPIRRYASHDQPGDDLSATTTPAERLTVVTELTRDAWAAARLPVPDYRRSEAPGRIWRGIGEWPRSA